MNKLIFRRKSKWSVRKLNGYLFLGRFAHYLLFCVVHSMLIVHFGILLYSSGVYVSFEDSPTIEFAFDFIWHIHYVFFYGTFSPTSIIHFRYCLSFWYYLTQLFILLIHCFWIFRPTVLHFMIVYSLVSHLWTVPSIVSLLVLFA